MQKAFSPCCTGPNGNAASAAESGTGTPIARGGAAACTTSCCSAAAHRFRLRRRAGPALLLDDALRFFCLAEAALA
eukprot:CAMPEP_0179069448 /NCGR_PEP_ID=MMETSP0796-20121207/30512_1 /TAXON_ID=73915 /ORGANISM="Pyrodinium bahamense, Strain pbaha01" /LENGTH=75 /DNA_ID=CAMNT_0020766513 /DNA_START=95 /DNA_END=319 /DNA_ORIENTATION=-